MYIKNSQYTNIWITDDNFTFNLKRAKNLLYELINKRLTENMKIVCSSWTKIDKEFLVLAKQANITTISFGIESTSQKILNFYKKDIDLERTKKIIEYANQIGLFTVGNFIVGAPMETEETINNTFQYATDTPFDQVNIKTLDYMAGSELYSSLPKEITDLKRHLFACKENNLNKFSITELRNKINNFKKIFILSRKSVIKKKIYTHGLPYQLRNN